MNKKRVIIIVIILRLVTKEALAEMDLASNTDVNETKCKILELDGRVKGIENEMPPPRTAAEISYDNGAITDRPLSSDNL